MKHPHSNIISFEQYHGAIAAYSLFVLYFSHVALAKWLRQEKC